MTLDQHGSGVLRIPMNILLSMLCKVAERCAKIDDRELNGLMLRMALYAKGDPEDRENYDASLVDNPPGVDAAAMVNAEPQLRAALEEFMAYAALDEERYPHAKRFATEMGSRCVEKGRQALAQTEGGGQPERRS